MREARDLICQALGLTDLPDGAGPGAVPEWDSLGHMRIILAIEAERGAPLTSEELMSVWDEASVAHLLRAT